MTHVFKYLVTVVLLMTASPSFSQSAHAGDFNSELLTADITKWMHRGKIPGMAMVVIEDSNVIIKRLGMADMEKHIPVTDKTLFQLDGGSEPFVGFLITQLSSAGALDLKKKVSDYLPWFHATYKAQQAAITVEQLLYHTSGISSQEILRVQREGTIISPVVPVMPALPISLHNAPGAVYAPAPFNYQLLVLMIEKVTRQPYAKYLSEQVFAALKMSDTKIGAPSRNDFMSTSYKIGFFKPRAYVSPAHNGRNILPPIVTDAADMAKWVLYQLKHADATSYDGRMRVQNGGTAAHLKNKVTSTTGWKYLFRPMEKKRYTYSQGPDFSAYIAFLPNRKTGIIVLANSNSKYTPAIGDKYLNYLSGGSLTAGVQAEEDSDDFYSMISIILVLFVLAMFFFICSIFYDLHNGSRQYNGKLVLGKLVLALVVLAPFVYGLYLFPIASGSDWSTMVIWSPVSFVVAMILFYGLIGLSFLAYALNICFVQKSRFRQLLPMILVLSIFSGVANIIVITLISNAFTSGVEIGYLIFYYILAIAVYLLGRRFVQISLTRYSMDVVYELRTQLVNKIFATSYQKFEAIDRGRVYTSLNNDIFQISATANTVVVFFGGIFTIVGGFVYLTLLAFWSTVLIISVFSIMSVIYYFVTQHTNKYFERSRDSENVFMRFVNGMIDGYKEISLHKNKKTEYKNDLADAAKKFRDNMLIANLRYVDVFLVGESLLVILLGFVVFALPYFFREIQVEQITGFVIILLYVIAPIENVLGAIPGFMQLKIARKRITQFLSEIPANLEADDQAISNVGVRKVTSLRAEGVVFKYKTNDEPNPFMVGPVDLEIKSGEILFIIGGNGSGKTTLSKLLTGLYEADEGCFYINNNPVYFFQLSEYFSVSFSPAFLFEKLYNINVEEKREEMKKYLKILHLEDKVKIEDNKYNTIKLSGGQIKRLALLQCYLEDSPIYLFDEWAADQDPEYRNFFYRTLLPDMKRKGKIVIAITHDDHYFDVADKVLKMKQGKLEVYNNKTMFLPVKDQLIEENPF